MSSDRTNEHDNIARIGIFVSCFALYFFNIVGIMNSGDGTQYALTKALAEDGTIKIDNYRNFTYGTDYALYKNHTYSDRSFAQSVLPMPFYFVGKLMEGVTNYPYNGNHPGINEDSTLQVHTITSSAFFGALAVLIVYEICRSWGFHSGVSAVTSLLFGIGTLHWKYSAVLYRQPQLIFFILLAYLLICKLKDNHRLFYISALGLCAGVVGVIDNSYIPVSVVLIATYLIQNRARLKYIHLGVLVISGSIPILISLYYNQLAFEKMFTNPYFYEENPNWAFMKDKHTLFQSPLLPSLQTNLFSDKPVQLEAIAPILKNDLTLFNNTSAIWATRYRYKGIVVQSPFLIMSLIGFLLAIFKEKTKRTVLFSILISAILVLIVQSKYTMFYSANSYDTRFFLPAVSLLAIGLSWYIKYSSSMKILKWLFIGLLAVCSVISVGNAGYSAMSNYAPNVTGEHRMESGQFKRPLRQIDNLVENANLGFQHLFPNIYNLHILIFYIGVICGGMYFLKYMGKHVKAI